MRTRVTFSVKTVVVVFVLWIVSLSGVQYLNGISQWKAQAADAPRVPSRPTRPWYGQQGTDSPRPEVANRCLVAQSIQFTDASGAVQYTLTLRRPSPNQAAKLAVLDQTGTVVFWIPQHAQLVPLVR